MKILIRLIMLSTVITLLAFLQSCKSSDDSTPPAPQITSNKSSVQIAADASDTVKLTVSSPALLASLEADVDKGTVTISDLTGLNTNTGTAKLIYTAPDDLGTYTIVVIAKDKANQVTQFSITVTISAKPPVALAAGDVSGTLERNTTYLAGGTLVVPAGKTLTIQEGVTLIFDGDGTQNAPELTVAGNLYVYGTKNFPVVFTVPEEKRIAGNIFGKFWGGINGLTTCSEMVLQYATIEYTGATAGTGNPSVPTVYADGDPRYGLLFNNLTGKFVMQNSRIAYTFDDGMRIIGGQILVTNNTFESTGSTGGEAINIKAGTTGDVAYNLIYRAATNGVKWSNTKVPVGANQCSIAVYNNTVIESGWRQLQAGRGGSLNIEKGARGKIYNNMVVGCKYGIRLVSDADSTNTNLGYDFNYGNEQVIVDQFYPASGTIVKGKKETSHDVSGNVGENDPGFANYQVTDFVSANNTSTSSVTYLVVSDFHLSASSKAIGKGKTDFKTSNLSLTIDGKTYTSIAPSGFIGALGTN